MDKLFDIINTPLAWVLKFIAGIFGGNFAAAVFVFTLLINIAFIPLTIKSQKSAVQQMRIKPKLDELKKKYGDDKQKYSQAMAELYQKENVSMSGGCLPMILRLVIMLSIYTLLTSPITYLMGIDVGNNVNEIKLIDEVLANPASNPEIYRAAQTIDFNFFGIRLTQTPQFNFNIFAKFEPIWIMPLLAFACQLISSVFSMKMQKKTNPDAPSMTGMMLLMPMISLFIGFGLPGGVTFYWACSSLIGGFAQIAVQQFYGPHRLLANERAKELVKQCDFEAGQISKFGKHN